MQLLLLRHAEAEGNATARMLGNTDVPLTPAGCQQARQVAQALAQRRPPDLLLSSELQRARQTAELLVHGLQKTPPLEIWPELNEIDLGCFSGLTWPEAHTRYPDLCYQLEGTVNGLPIPGAESPQAARQRAEACWQRLQQLDRACVWLVSHGGFLQHFISVILGSPVSWGLSIAPLALFEFDQQFLPRNAPEIERYNTARWQIRNFNQMISAGNPG